MKKLALLLLAAISVSGCQRITDLQRPEDYAYHLPEGAGRWERTFTGFWTGMNNNYVFWDIDPTDWEKVYQNYRSRFTALDALKNTSKDELLRRAKDYFIEITKNLIDGQFSLTLEDDPGLPIMPGLAKYYEQFGANYYDQNTWERSGVLRSEMMAETTEALINNIQNYSRPGTLSTGESGDLLAAVCKIPLRDNSNDNILYFCFSDFRLYKNLVENNAPPPDLLNVWNYFKNNVYAGDIRGVIVDVRGNSGGDIADLSLIWGKVFSKTRYQIGYQKQKIGDGRLDFAPLVPFYIFGDPENPRDLQVPLALLVNKGSASCSELSALFVRSLPKGFLVGGTTFGGQGAVTDNEYFNAGQFSTLGIELCGASSTQTLDLGKKSFEGKGLEPDYPVTFDYSLFSQGADRRLEKAIEVIQTKQ